MDFDDRNDYPCAAHGVMDWDERDVGPPLNHNYWPIVLLFAAVAALFFCLGFGCAFSWVLGYARSPFA